MNIEQVAANDTRVAALLILIENLISSGLLLIRALDQVAVVSLQHNGRKMKEVMRFPHWNWDYNCGCLKGITSQDLVHTDKTLMNIGFDQREIAALEAGFEGWDDEDVPRDLPGESKMKTMRQVGQFIYNNYAARGKNKPRLTFHLLDSSPTESDQECCAPQTAIEEEASV